MPRRPTVHNRLTPLLGLALAAVFAVGVLFPTAHVVYPDAHDDAKCVLMAIVDSGAVALAAVVCFALALFVFEHLLASRPVRVCSEVPLPFSSRAPPE